KGRRRLWWRLRWIEWIQCASKQFARILQYGFSWWWRRARRRRPEEVIHPWTRECKWQKKTYCLLAASPWPRARSYFRPPWPSLGPWASRQIKKPSQLHKLLRRHLLVRKKLRTRSLKRQLALMRTFCRKFSDRVVKI